MEAQCGVFVNPVLTLGERLPVVEATHELLGVKGCALLRSGLQRSSSTHLVDRNKHTQREVLKCSATH